MTYKKSGGPSPLQGSRSRAVSSCYYGIPSFQFFQRLVNPLLDFEGFTSCSVEDTDTLVRIDWDLALVNQLWWHTDRTAELEEIAFELEEIRLEILGGEGEVTWSG